MKIENLSFFKKKLGQEIKNRKKPGKNGKIRKSKKSYQKSFQKSIKNDRFSLAHSGGSSVPLGTIINSSRTNPRFGPSFK